MFGESPTHTAPPPPADYIKADRRPLPGALGPGDLALWGTHQPVCTLDQATPECHIRNKKKAQVKAVPAHLEHLSLHLIGPTGVLPGLEGKGHQDREVFPKRS